MTRREPKRSTQSAALNRPARKRYSDAAQPTKSARPPSQAEGVTRNPTSRERAGWRFAGECCQCLADPAGIGAEVA
jgi:hypothetical protein